LKPPIDILTASPCRAGARAWRSARDGDACVVVCRRSYALEAGEAAPSEQQPPLVEADSLAANGALLAPSDFAPSKRQVDVVLTGRAYAPRGTSASRLSCHFVVGPLEKAFEVRADRYVDLDGLLRDEARFTAAPLGWEQAAGGPDTSNPIGIGWRRDERGRLHLPKLQPLAFEPSPPDWQVPTVGLGPLASSWPERSRHLARHGGAPIEALLRDGLPADFDFDYFQVAPVDQRLTRLERDARIILGNLHPAADRVVVNLSGEWARCIVEPTGQELDMTLDTVAIDTERLLVTLTWRVSFFTRELPEVRAARVVLEERGLRRSVEALRALPIVELPYEIEDPPSNGEALPFLGQKPRSVAVLGQSQIGTRPPPESLAGTPFVPAGAGTTPTASRPPRSTRTMSMKLTELAEAEPAFLRASGRTSTVPSAPAMGSGVPLGPTLEPATPTPPPPIIPATVSSHSAAAPRAPSRPPPPAATPSTMSNSSSYGPPAVALPAAPAVQPATPPAVVPPATTTGAAFVATAPSATPFNTAELAARAKPPSYLLGVDPLPSGAIPTHAAGSAQAGLVAASDAAAHVEPRSSSATPRDESRSEHTRASRGPGFLDLLWWQPDAHERLRRSPKWAKIVRLPPAKGAWLGDDDGDARSKDPPERIVARALARGECLSAAGVAREVLESVDDDGLLVRPIVVVEGEVQLSFDPRDTLEATLSFAEPTIVRDSKIKEAYDAASELLKGERKVTVPMVESATKRVRQAFASSTTRSFAPDYLEVTVERWLLDERRFHKRVVLGQPRLVSSITPQGSSSTLPIYLPAELESHVPTLPRFKVRVLAEPHGRQDAAEAESTSLLALAFARVMGR